MKYSISTCGKYELHFFAKFQRVILTAGTFNQRAFKSFFNALFYHTRVLIDNGSLETHVYTTYYTLSKTILNLIVTTATRTST